MPFENIDREKAPYPPKSGLDQAVGSAAQGVANFARGVVQPEAFPEYHRGMGTPQDSWAGRTGGRLRTATEMPADVLMGMAGGGGKSSPQVTAQINRLAALAKQGNIDAKAELAAHFGPMFSRIGQRVRPVIGSEKGGLEPSTSAKDIAQQFQVTLQNAIKNWNPAENDNFEAYVMSQGKKAPGMAKRMESVVAKGGMDKVQKQILALTDEYHTRFGTPKNAAEEVKRDGFIARRIQGDWTQIADQMPEQQARQTMLKQAMEMVKDARAQMARVTRTDVSTDPRSKAEGVHRQIPEGLTFQQGTEPTPNHVAEQRKAILIKAQQKMDPIDARIAELAQQIDPATGRTMSVRAIAKKMTEEGQKISFQRVDQRMKRVRKTAQDVEKGQGFEGGDLPPIGGGSDAPDPWGSKPTRTDKPRPREMGENPREQATNPRFTGDNPRFQQELARQQAEWQASVSPEQMAAKHKLKYQGQWDLGGGRKGPHEFRIEHGPAKGGNVTVNDLRELEARVAEAQAKFSKAKAGLSGLELRNQQTTRELNASDKQYPRAGFAGLEE